jgi:hypothetical protein
MWALVAPPDGNEGEISMDKLSLQHSAVVSNAWMLRRAGKRENDHGANLYLTALLQQRYNSAIQGLIEVGGPLEYECTEGELVERPWKRNNNGTNNNRCCCLTTRTTTTSGAAVVTTTVTIDCTSYCSKILLQYEYVFSYVQRP